MKRKILVFAALVVSSLFFQCSKELELNDPSKQVTIVYAIINPSEPTQYFKIYKGYLTDGNAIEAAQHWDNIYYHVDSIEVKLVEYNGANKVKEFLLDTTTAIPKDSGVFTYPAQLLYCTDEVINDESEYELVITLASGKVVKSRIPICQSFRYSNLSESSQIALTAKKSTISFTSSANALAYDIYQIFHYVEISKHSGEIVKRGSVKRKLNPSLITNLSNESKISYSYAGNSIYSAIANELKQDNTVTRYRDDHKCVEFIVYAAGEELLVYINSQTPTTSIVTDINIYSNIESEDGSGFGIFSSRNHIKGRYNIDNKSEDSLVRGSITRHLGFDYLRNRPDMEN
ncbi:hypothetical protein LJC68_01625 [Bacteroidales bacterium OttesenSCG-928-B11]|nr:hypothetical protein [Bacteroidales bacterium OttesenSCG-928-E04]MDL2309216.1 hypothetical protein [Bacteroidales bacterium OttesenSCG-928-C03]MDL2311564.1 hypothetical protein [Bacteroidales bacterium OttesenSCG-928-B11]MDL2325607.1 hypothetical protein [Bacteroidales bacterium OttesenSCG-928-A14]